MDSLLAEIAAKKSALTQTGNADAGPSTGGKKYMRRAEVEAAEEEAERRKKEVARERLRAEKEARLAKKGGTVSRSLIFFFVFFVEHSYLTIGAD